MIEPTTHALDLSQIVDHEDYETERDLPDASPWRITSKDDLSWCLSLRFQHVSNVGALKRRIENLQQMVMAEQKAMARWDRRFRDEVAEFIADELDGARKRSVMTEWGRLGFRMGRASLKVLDTKLAIEWARDKAPDAVVVDERLVTGPLQGRTDLPDALFEAKPAEDRFFIDMGESK